MVRFKFVFIHVFFKSYWPPWTSVSKQLFPVVNRQYYTSGLLIALCCILVCMFFSIDSYILVSRYDGSVFDTNTVLISVVALKRRLCENLTLLLRLYTNGHVRSNRVWWLCRLSDIWIFDRRGQNEPWQKYVQCALSIYTYASFSVFPRQIYWVRTEKPERHETQSSNGRRYFGVFGFDFKQRLMYRVRSQHFLRFQMNSINNKLFCTLLYVDHSQISLEYFCKNSS